MALSECSNAIPGWGVYAECTEQFSGLLLAQVELLEQCLKLGRYPA